MQGPDIYKILGQDGDEVRAWRNSNMETGIADGTMAESKPPSSVHHLYKDILLQKMIRRLI